jgi:hypothetical protein
MFSIIVPLFSSSTLYSELVGRVMAQMGVRLSLFRNQRIPSLLGTFYEDQNLHFFALFFLPNILYNEAACLLMVQTEVRLFLFHNQHIPSYPGTFVEEEDLLVNFHLF